MLLQITTKYLSTLDPRRLPAPAETAKTLLEMTTAAFTYENLRRARGNKLLIPTMLTYQQVAAVLLTMHGVKRVTEANSDRNKHYPLLASHDHEADTYVPGEVRIRELVEQYSPGLSINQTRKLFHILRTESPWIAESDIHAPELVPA
jgi:hypothetical protein